MKMMFLSAAAAFLVIGGAAHATTVDPDIKAVRVPAIVVVAKHKEAQVASNPLAKDNPTGLPAYEMRPDGLMINGLLPANGWEG